jgi:hypothetical protein
MTGLNLVPGSMPPSCGMNAHAATECAKGGIVIGKSRAGLLRHLVGKQPTARSPVCALFSSGIGSSHNSGGKGRP